MMTCKPQNDRMLICMLTGCSSITSISPTSSCSPFVCSSYLLHRQSVMRSWRSSPWKRRRASSGVSVTWTRPARRSRRSWLVPTSALSHRSTAVRRWSFNRRLNLFIQLACRNKEQRNYERKMRKLFTKVKRLRERHSYAHKSQQGQLSLPSLMGR